jgi:DNA primase
VGIVDEDVARVRESTDIVALVSEHLALKRVGRRYVGLCPFHQEKTPSFSVNAERQFYHCFSCKAGGDVFRFVQETEKVGFLEAVELLSRRAGIPIPERGVPGERGARARLHDALEKAAVAYEQWLGDPQIGAETRAYLERRGITAETRRKFRLGYAPAGWEQLVTKLRGALGEDVLLEGGLAGRRDGGRGLFDRFRNRLMVPLIVSGGQVVGFGARALAAEDNPKYLNSPETPVYHKGAFLYALDQARRAVGPEDEIIVVEGYFDAMALHQAGLAHTVATSGTALTPEQAQLLRRVVPRVVLTYDGDSAGREAMMRSLAVLMAEGLDVRIVDLPTGDDPDTLIRRGGGIEAWTLLRSGAADPVEFVQRHLLRRAAEREGPGADPRERALQAVADLAVRVTDPIRRSLLFERAEQVLGFPAAVLERAAAGRRAPAPAPATPAAPGARPVTSTWRRGGEPQAELQLLTALLREPETVAPAREQVDVSDFRDPLCAKLARWIWEGGEGWPSDADTAALARELVAHDDESNWVEQARGAVRVLVQRRLKAELKERQQQLRHPHSGEEESKLLKEITELGQSLKDWSTSF